MSELGKRHEQALMVNGLQAERIRELEIQVAAHTSENYEYARKQRHHEVLCLVLREGYRAKYNRRTEDNALDIQRDANEAASLAYPPPSAAQDELVTETVDETHRRVVKAPPCEFCGARQGDAYTSGGHFLINDEECPGLRKPKAPPWTSLPDEGT